MDSDTKSSSHNLTSILLLDVLCFCPLDTALYVVKTLQPETDGLVLN